MNEKTIEILIQLLGHIKENDLDVESLSEFSESLIIRGYNEREVAEALSWLFDKLNFLTVKSTEIAEQKQESVRILHDYERLKISPEVYGYLLKLKALSVINGSQMEKVLDYCMLLGADTLEESEIDEIVASILFDDH
ncbi:MAG: DUF494 family protein [Candidatus Latescibacter sp.]|nr:DUF494 family protein [Candidatus Latescibacter sp.]